MIEHNFYLKCDTLNLPPDNMSLNLYARTEGKGSYITKSFNYLVLCLEKWGGGHVQILIDVRQM